MKLKNQMLLELNSALQRYSKTKKEAFGHAIARNLAKIEGPVQIIRDINKPSEKFEEFGQKSNAIYASFAEMDEDGLPKILGGKFIIPESKDSDVQDRIRELRSEYKDVIDAHSKMVEEHQSELLRVLEEESEEISFYELKRKNIPEDTLIATDRLIFMKCGIIKVEDD